VLQTARIIRLIPLNRNYDEYDLTTQDEWTGVLKLATRWSFSSIRSLAIRRLEPFLVSSALDRLVLARACSVEQWVDIAARNLSSRFGSLEESELCQMTYGDIALITRKRERLWRERGNNQQGNAQLRLEHMRQDPQDLESSTRLSLTASSVPLNSTPALIMVSYSPFRLNHTWRKRRRTARQRKRMGVKLRSFASLTRRPSSSARLLPLRRPLVSTQSGRRLRLTKPLLASADSTRRPLPLVPKRLLQPRLVQVIAQSLQVAPPPRPLPVVPARSSPFPIRRFPSSHRNPNNSQLQSSRSKEQPPVGSASGIGSTR
jgi:hypothetical protein